MERNFRRCIETTIKKYKHIDKNGRKFRLHGRNLQGSPVQNITDLDPKWLKTNPELCRVDYLDEKSGVGLGIGLLWIT